MNNFVQLSWIPMFNCCLGGRELLQERNTFRNGSWRSCWCWWQVHGSPILCNNSLWYIQAFAWIRGLTFPHLMLAYALQILIVFSAPVPVHRSSSMFLFLLFYELISFPCNLTFHVPVIFFQTLKRPSTDFLDKIQKDINSSMRSILVDWLVEVA